MTRSIKYILWCVPLFFVLHPASAFEVLYQDTFDQGTTMEIQVPKSDISALVGNLGTTKILFHETTEYPKDHAVISRGAFMEMLFSQEASLLSKDGWSQSKGFPDVTGKETFAPSVYYAQSLGYIAGYEDGLFHPQDPLTRAQAAKILVGAFQPQEVLKETPVLKDLSPRHPLASFMYAALRAGIFQGYEDGTIQMDRHLSYIEAEILTNRSAKSRNLPVHDFKRSPQIFYTGYVGAHRINDFGTKTLRLQAIMENGSQETQEYPILIRKVTYKTNSFSLPPSKTKLFEGTAYTTTWKMIDEAKAVSDAKKLWEGAFIIPAKGEVSMGFGEKVIINGVLSGSHFGIDYANRIGTPVLASNTGRVVLSAYTPSYGNTLILDHGMNVFTMYMHMSELLAEEGQTVTKGETIGKIGATGIATGPHLHFNHFIGNIIVDSQQWFDGQF